jgi:hypothetical protein
MACRTRTRQQCTHLAHADEVCSENTSVIVARDCVRATGTCTKQNSTGCTGHQSPLVKESMGLNHPARRCRSAHWTAYAQTHHSNCSQGLCCIHSRDLMVQMCHSMRLPCRSTQEMQLAATVAVARRAHSHALPSWDVVVVVHTPVKSNFQKTKQDTACFGVARCRRSSR